MFDMYGDSGGSRSAGMCKLNSILLLILIRTGGNFMLSIVSGDSTFICLFLERCILTEAVRSVTFYR